MATSAVVCLILQFIYILIHEGDMLAIAVGCLVNMYVVF
jgi:hypothetical protein